VGLGCRWRSLINDRLKREMIFNKYLPFLIFLLPTFTFGEGLYVGFQIGAISRGGFIVGYQVDPRDSIELHLGGGPGFMTYGASLKSRDPDGGYRLLGYTKVTYFHKTEVTRSHGFNIGFGQLDPDQKEVFPLEIGGGLGYDFERSKLYPNMFFGFGILAEAK